MRHGARPVYQDADHADVHGIPVALQRLRISAAPTRTRRHTDSPEAPTPMNQMLSPPPPKLASTIRFAAVPTAVGCARIFTKQTLRHWQISEAIDDVELVVSELITNAVVATGVLEPHPDNAALAQAAKITLRLSVVDEALRIEAWDESVAMPNVLPHDQQAESGRGMVLVGAMSSRWGAIAAPDGSGKVVWADVALHDEHADSLQPATPVDPDSTNEPALRTQQAAAADIAMLERVLLGLKRLGDSLPEGVQSVDDALFSD